VLDEFVVYRTPDIKPVAEEVAEGEKAAAIRVLERGAKGQGEYELPSAVYVSRGVKNLSTNCRRERELTLVFDGVLKSGDKEAVMHAVPFETLSIGNLVELNEHHIEKQIWIQSRVGATVSNGGVWYELGHPAEEYKAHWEAFHWMALLVKYVSDALEINVERKQMVGLKYFRRDFALEMTRVHGGDSHFQHWMSAFGKGSFPSI